MKTLATTLATLALCSLPVLGADATGKWEATITSPRGEMAFVFDLKADGEALTGTISNEMMGDSEIKDGKVSGDEVSFKQELERGPRVITFSYTGKVNGDEMELTRTVEGMGGGRGGKKGGERPGGQAGPGEGRGGRGGGMGREMTFTAKRLK
jgi:hypothetical protein